MKQWSKYNTLLKTERFGFFLYNSLSNVMIELDEAHVRMIEALRDHGSNGNASGDSEFCQLLEETGILASREEEKLHLMKSRYQRNAVCFSTGYIGLTICPTLACNFGCPYCFEQSQNDGTIMSAETIDNLFEFIKKHRDSRNLAVSWYGGEPTLAFGVIKTLTGRFLELFPDYDHAGMVTNGYLLDQEKIDQLNDLKISSVQITLDGNADTHNQRRMLKNGGATFQTILNNVDALMNSSYKGSCAIRVNIDKTNQHEYQPLRAELLERFKGKNLTVYPGHVKTAFDHQYAHSCTFCSSEWAEFTIGAYYKDGDIPKGGFYPANNAFNTCIANSHNGYVVGPAGELYKCWEDVGQERMVIGSINGEEALGNPALVARYSIGTDPFNDPECMECAVMPICGGGCVNKRMRVHQFGEEGLEFCSPYRERLANYLEAYFDTYRTREICGSILGTSARSAMKNGYRMVQPEKKKEEVPKNPLKNLAGQDAA